MVAEVVVTAVGSRRHLHLLHHILHLHHVDVLDALRLELRPPLLDELFPHLYMGMWGGRCAISRDARPCSR